MLAFLFYALAAIPLVSALFGGPPVSSPNSGLLCMNYGTFSGTVFNLTCTKDPFLLQGFERYTLNGSLFSGDLPWGAFTPMSLDVAYYNTGIIYPDDPNVYGPYGGFIPSIQGLLRDTSGWTTSLSPPYQGVWVASAIRQGNSIPIVAGYNFVNVTGNITSGGVYSGLAVLSGGTYFGNGTNGTTNGTLIQKCNTYSYGGFRCTVTPFAVKTLNPTYSFGGLFNNVTATQIVPYGIRRRRTTPLTLMTAKAIEPYDGGFSYLITYSTSSGPCAANVSAVDPAGLIVVGQATSSGAAMTIPVINELAYDDFLLSLECGDAYVEQYFKYDNPQSCTPPSYSYDLYGQAAYSWCAHPTWRMLMVLVFIVLGYLCIVVLFQLLRNIIVIAIIFRGAWAVSRETGNFVWALCVCIYRVIRYIFRSVVAAAKPTNAQRTLAGMALLGLVAGQPFSGAANFPNVAKTGCEPFEVGQLTLELPKYSSGAIPIASSTLLTCEPNSRNCTLNSLVASNLQGTYGSAVVVTLQEATLNNSVVNLVPTTFLVAPIRMTYTMTLSNSYLTYMNYRVENAATYICGGYVGCAVGSQSGDVFPFEWWGPAHSGQGSCNCWGGDTPTCDCTDVGCGFGESYHTLCCAVVVEPADYADLYVVGSLTISNPTMRYFVGVLDEGGDLVDYQCVNAPSGQQTEVTTPDGSVKVTWTGLDHDPLGVGGKVLPVVWHAGRDDSSQLGDVFTGPVSEFGQGQVGAIGHLQWVTQPSSMYSPMVRPHDWGFQYVDHYDSAGDAVCHVNYPYFVKESLALRPYQNLSTVFAGAALDDFKIVTGRDTAPRLSGSVSLLQGAASTVTLTLADLPVVWTTAAVCPEIVNVSITGCANCAIPAEIAVTLYSSCYGGYATLGTSGTFAEAVGGSCILKAGSDNTVTCNLYAMIANIAGYVTVTASAKTTASFTATYTQWEDDRIPWNGGASNESVFQSGNSGGGSDFWDAFDVFGGLASGLRDALGDVFGGFIMILFLLAMSIIGIVIVFQIAVWAFNFMQRKRGKEPSETKGFGEMLKAFTIGAFLPRKGQDEASLPGAASKKKR